MGLELGSARVAQLGSGQFMIGVIKSKGVIGCSVKQQRPDRLTSNLQGHSPPTHSGGSVQKKNAVESMCAKRFRRLYSFYFALLHALVNA